MRVEDFDFELPDRLIAQSPLPERAASRLLALERNSGVITDDTFRNLLQWLRSGDLLIFNDTKVIKARLRGEKETGGRVEILIERLIDANHATAQLRASHKPKEGSRILVAGEAIVVAKREGEFSSLIFPSAVTDFLERHGSVPLPPYIARAAGDIDETRYQTVYSSVPGAVAAPTAGLHFDQAMLHTLTTMGVLSARLTLHIGAGTFQPVRVSDVSQHRMHREQYAISAATAQAVRAAMKEGRRVIAVGTTSLRALESAALAGQTGAHIADTDLFILPGFKFHVVDALITNFHLPRSTLLMLVSAFAGVENIRRAYAHAIASNYRFFSYGDAMLIHGNA